MSSEVNHAHATGTAVDGSVVVIAVKQCIVAAWLPALAGISLVFLKAQALVVQCGGVGALVDGGVLPVGRIVIPLREQRCVALPSVEVG